MSSQTPVRQTIGIHVRFAAVLETLGLHTPTQRVALALSGGGDSVALMILLARWAAVQGATPPDALIVDHGFRPEQRLEATRTARQARALRLRAHVLRWKAEKPGANIEDAARIARYRLMGAWCRAHRVSVLFVAHTRDDQAETFLLRLGRGSGVDGLSAMRARASFPLPGYGGLELARPLLDFGRNELRAFLKEEGAAWIEDPMNDDARFARTRIRKLLPELEWAGVSTQRIAAAAEHLARARDALDAQTDGLLGAHARCDGDGHIRLNARALLAAPREVGLRALSRVLTDVSGREYRPRFVRLERLFDTLTPQGLVRAATLHGCRIARAPARAREFGPGTLLIVPEGPRKTVRKTASGPKPGPKLGPGAGPKRPQKRHNVAP